MEWRSMKMAVLHLRRKHFLFATITLSLLLVWYNASWAKDSPKMNEEEEETRPVTSGGPQQRGQSRTILLWHRPFGAGFSLEGNVCWDQFNIPGCKVVDDRSYFSSADVVVFHNRELVNGQEKVPLQLPRPQGQRWAWLTMESPSHNGNLKPFDNIFNMTITHRRDSDVYAPYGEVHPRKDGGAPVESANRTHFACWVVSNFQTHHKRNQLYDELKDLIPIEVYGRWVGKPLSFENLLPTLRNCRFYLSFENSQHRDYITEKLWYNSYGSGAIPVVFGAPLEDYKAAAPPHSFIHVDEFASVKDLANHLLQVAKDDTLYKQYFAWKQKFEVKVYPDCRNILCSICLVLDKLPACKIYSDLGAWNNA